MRSGYTALGFLSLWLLVSCNGTEKQTLTEFLDEHSTILQDLGSYDKAERARAINTIKGREKEFGSRICLHLLMEKKMLTDKNAWDYRTEVVLARILADWRDKRAMGYLVSFLGHQDQGAEDIAKEGLMVFKDDPKLIDVLSEQLKSPVVNQRRVAAEILSEVGGSKAVDLFGERYKSEHEREIRALFLLKIAESNHSRKAEFLITALTDIDEGLRYLAWGTLKEEKGLPAVKFEPRGAPGERADAIARLRMWLKTRK